jgi:hypothetical protein
MNASNLKERSRPVRRTRALVAVLLAMILTGTATAQRLPQAGAAGSAAGATTAADFESLVGAWVRPDGGYLILIRKVAADGTLEAMYFNPNPLPFEKARASRDGAVVRLAFELQAGGYSGSTYQLTYDRASDRLSGTYYQAVARQSFAVTFARK